MNNKSYYEDKLKKEKEKSEIREIKRQIKETKKANKNKRAKTTTTKRLIAYILINCTVIEVYSMAIMAYLRDLSALYTLIGAVVTESISFAVYCAKAFKETKEEAIMKLERDKFNAGFPLEEETPPDMSNMEVKE